MNEAPERRFQSREALDRVLSEDVAAVLAAAIAARDKATLVVSGGSTPLGLFRLLADVELPWDKVTVLLADERWVGPDHEDSNEKLVRDNFLINRAAAARLVSLKTGHADARAAEPQLNRTLAAFGPFDLVILGMGDDGHTASLFPGAKELQDGLDAASGRHCIAVTPTFAPWQRMSMTLPRLLRSRQIILHITGQGKKAVAESARENNRPRDAPVAAVLNQHIAPVTVYWAA